MNVAMINSRRWSDGSPRFNLEIYREGPRELGGYVRREQWVVCAKDGAEAVKTVDYHFGLSVKWFRLDPQGVS